MSIYKRLVVGVVIGALLFLCTARMNDWFLAGPNYCGSASTLGQCLGVVIRDPLGLHSYHVQAGTPFTYVWSGYYGGEAPIHQFSLPAFVGDVLIDLIVGFLMVSLFARYRHN